MYTCLYRSTLHSLVSKEKRRDKCGSVATSIDSHVNFRYLSSPDKRARMHKVVHNRRLLQLKLSRLRSKLSDLVEDHGVVLDTNTSSDLYQIMMEEDQQVQKSNSEDTFKSIFWQQQKDSLSRGKKGMRWHPLMIKWCLYLRHQSSKAYELLRESGCISLPSQRTLRDYSHCVKAGAGFSTDVDAQLAKAVNMESCPEWHKLVILLIDEMHIREDLVYDKHTGRMIGFVDLGSINNHLVRFEQSIEGNNDKEPVLAKSMMGMMVRGLFTQLRFPYAQFRNYW